MLLSVPNYYKKLLFISYLLLFLLQVSSAQQRVLPSEYYSLNEGLSDRLVTDILQSRFGFVWLATPNGLNKFDGYDFTIFNNYSGAENSHKISGSNIERLEEDQNGNIVILYQNNITYFDLLNPRTHENKQVSLVFQNGLRGIVRDIEVNQNKEIRVLTSNSDSTYIFGYTEDGSFEELIKMKGGRSPNAQFIELQNGLLFINDDENGLRLIGPNAQPIKTFTTKDFIHQGKSLKYPETSLFLYEDVGGRVWLSMQDNNMVFQYNPEQRKFIQFNQIPQDGVYSKIWEDRKGNILLAKSPYSGTSPPVIGLYCITLSGDVLDFNHLTEFSNLIISAYSEDFFKTIFLGIDTGLKIIQNNKTKVKKYLTENVPIDRRGIAIRGITGNEKDHIYFAQESNHWFTLDLEHNYLDTIILRDDNTGQPLEYACSFDLHYNKSTNSLWGLGCPDNGKSVLIKYDLEECTTQIFPTDRKVNAFTVDRNGIFWLGCVIKYQEGQLISFNPVTEKFKIYRDKEETNPLKDAIPHFLLESEDKTLWIGTENGLVRIDRRLQESHIMRVNEGESFNLSNNTIYVIHEDEEKNLWLGTKNGLNKLNPNTGEVQVLNTDMGLAHNSICGILSGKNNNLWISTYNGLSYFDTQKRVFKNFYQIDGLSHDEFNRFSFYKDKTGRCYLGGVNGLNAFYEEELLVKERNPPVFLTRISRYNTKQEAWDIQDSHLHDLKEIPISPYDTYFQIHFALPNYSRPINNQFWALLEGFDKDWIYLGNDHSLTYNGLPHGKFELQLRGADHNGNMSEEKLSITLDVEPIFYKTWWFYLSVALAVILFVYVLFQYLLDQRLQVERFRMKLSSDLHDEVSGLLSGIAMQTDVLQMLAKEEESKVRLKTIGDVSRKAMSKMNDVIWSIDSRKDKVEDLISRMREHADDILLPINIRYEFLVGKVDRHQKLPVNIRQNLYFIYKEAINNIAKHSDASEVIVAFGNNGTAFEMSIKDDGPGKTKPPGKSGQGLANIQMRAQRIKAKLNIQRENGYTIHLRMKKFG